MADSSIPAPFALPAERPAGFRGEWMVDESRRSAFAEHSGILRALPAAVAVPDDADDVAALVRWAAKHRVPLVPRSAGTGMPGGNVGPGVAVDLRTAFEAVGWVDAERRLARVLPGATLHRLNDAAAEDGLHFPVDPSSGARATLGGIIANNSAGSHTVRYGAARRWIESLDVVLADGTALTTTRGQRVSISARFASMTASTRSRMARSRGCSSRAPRVVVSAVPSARTTSRDSIHRRAAP
ncbi:MAG TPA: FAD-dependent oxidoreductase [Longimicrobium sp.]|nr:FAD-dependent oxidoreductase [Longimicrobium sp.]